MSSPPASQDRFPATSLGLIRRLSAPGDAPSPEAWADFYNRYRRPLLVFALLERRLSLPDGEDLVHSFVCYLMESPRLRKFDPSLGRFRTYLLVIFKRFGKDEAAGAKALKRGGGVEVGQIESRVAEYRAAGVDPAEAFAREWALAAVREAIDLCGRALEGVERRWLEVRYREPLEGGVARPTREEAAGRLGLTDGKAQGVERRVKEALRRFFEAQVRADISGGGGDVEAQTRDGIQELLHALGG